jgi:hypothetical protein
MHFALDFILGLCGGILGSWLHVEMLKKNGKSSSPDMPEPLREMTALERYQLRKDRHRGA